MEYLTWDQKTISDFSPSNISNLYNQGYVFTRIDKGVMYQTRSLRIDLSRFTFHTKNKRVLRLTEGLEYQMLDLPIAAENYSWEIHKLGKDYYQNKFGEGIFSANKIKELIIDEAKSNYNGLLKYTDAKDNAIVGYTIVYHNQDMLHYAYPFYDLNKYFNHYGMGMMLRGIQFALDSGKKYFYIGSVSRPADIYKLYFRGLEWFDGQTWSQDIEQVKGMIAGDTAEQE